MGERRLQEIVEANDPLALEFWLRPCVRDHPWKPCLRWFGCWCPLRARAFRFVGSGRHTPDEISPSTALGPRRFLNLGPLPRSFSLVMPFDSRGELARKPSRSSALPKWISASLPGCAGLPEYISHGAYDRRRCRVCVQPCGLRPTIPENEKRADSRFSRISSPSDCHHSRKGVCSIRVDITLEVPYACRQCHCPSSR